MINEIDDIYKNGIPAGKIIRFAGKRVIDQVKEIKIELIKLSMAYCCTNVDKKLGKLLNEAIDLINVEVEKPKSTTYRAVDSVYDYIKELLDSEYNQEILTDELIKKLVEVKNEAARLIGWYESRRGFYGGNGID